MVPWPWQIPYWELGSQIHQYLGIAQFTSNGSVAFYSIESGQIMNADKIYKKPVTAGLQLALYFLRN